MAVPKSQSFTSETNNWTSLCQHDFPLDFLPNGPRTMLLSWLIRILSGFKSAWIMLNLCMCLTWGFSIKIKTTNDILRTWPQGENTDILGNSVFGTSRAIFSHHSYGFLGKEIHSRHVTSHHLATRLRSEAAWCMPWPLIAIWTYNKTYRFYVSLWIDTSFGLSSDLFHPELLTAGRDIPRFLVYLKFPKIPPAFELK